jgi:ATP-dependent RNA helicase DDX35
MYPVEVAYLREPVPDYVQKAAEVIWNINLQVYSFHAKRDLSLI